MLATAAHLLLSGFQKVQYRGVVRELCIYGYRLHQHGHRMGQTLVCTPVVDGVEQHLLLVVEFRQQTAVSCCKEGTLEDAVLLAEGIDGIDTHMHCPRQQSFS